jgi:hypothetical protein
MSRQDLEQRVRRAAEAALAEKQLFSAIDVLLGLGWLAPSRVDEWRQGRVESLEREVQANLSKVTAAMAAFRRWARDRGLNPSETDYVARTRDRRQLRFSVSGDASIERADRTNCPVGRAEEIARYAAMRGSGRIGRSATGRSLDPDAVSLAVAASVRHVDTDYDRLLMSGVDRETARRRVRERVEDVLGAWRATSS